MSSTPPAAVTAPITAQAHIARVLRHDMDDLRWQADLFETRHPQPAPDRERVSARSAYQDSLYGRALILDLRDDAARARQGRLPAQLALEVRPGVDLAALAGRAVLYLLIEGATGRDAAERAVTVIEPAQLASFDRDRPVIKLVDGGADAWREAGLPVVS